MPLGDSITQGDTAGRFVRPGFDSYRWPLYQKLRQAGVAVDFVGSLRTTYQCAETMHSDFDPDHEGHWGWRVDEILNGHNGACTGSGKLSDWVAAAKPDIALIHLGTNDVYKNERTASTIEELREVAAVFRAQNPQITLFFAQLIPAYRWFKPKLGARVEALNAALPALVAELDRPESRVILVDQHSGFELATDSLDDLHPNRCGDEKMAERWFEAINRYLSREVPPFTRAP